MPSLFQRAIRILCSNREAARRQPRGSPEAAPADWRTVLLLVPVAARRRLHPRARFLLEVTRHCRVGWVRVCVRCVCVCVRGGGVGGRSSMRRPRGRGGGGAHAPTNFHSITIPSSCPALAVSSLISFSSFSMFSMIVVAHKLVFEWMKGVGPRTPCRTCVGRRAVAVRALRVSQVGSGNYRQYLLLGRLDREALAVVHVHGER